MKTRKKILILGVNGFIGHHLSNRILADTDWDVYGMDMARHRLGDLVQHRRMHFFEGDITINREWIEYHVRKCDVILPLVAMLAWQRVDTRTTLGLSFPGHGPRGAGTLVGAGLIGAGLFFLSAALLLAFGGGDGSPAVRDLSRRLLDLLGTTPWWISGALMVLLPAVAEELLYRGWVLAAFAGVSPSRGRAVAAVVAQAVVFALAHLLPERMPATCALGLATGALRVLTGGILPSIVLHAVHNAVPLVLVAMAGGPGGEQLAEIATGGATRLPPAVIAAAALAVVVGAGMVGFAARHRNQGRSPVR